ncbi:hypothetical protein GDO86_010093 [Hymenochirus boettgeri]|uniref:Uncharacterized protein n=1 Tax=Hymenochirus boettgeri TaxID=247094 RepID=A0A8T2JRZ2_9PIPI|nr:hypothetical protein GDO86_010093 [Hymenochirus boettgeri]
MPKRSCLLTKVHMYKTTVSKSTILRVKCVCILHCGCKILTTVQNTNICNFTPINTSIIIVHIWTCVNEQSFTLLVHGLRKPSSYLCTLNYYH